MSDVYLTRVDASQNMARYYRMTIQPTLLKANAFVNEIDAANAMTTLETSKVRKGYCPCQPH